MKIGVFGGTFNPIHLGHLNFCCQCNALYSFDRLLLIPTNQPPHKPVRHLASNEDRMAMLRLAIRDEPVFEASDIEYRMGGKSYTVDTLAALRREQPEGELFLLVGSDMLRTFKSWYRYERILAGTRLVVGARFMREYEELLALRESFGPLAQHIELADIRVRELSSSEIRRTIRHGGDAGPFLPRPVYDYILEHGLYRER